MKYNTLHQRFKNIISIGITLVIVILLILSGPTNAVRVDITDLSTEYTKDNNVEFKISITLYGTDDRYVPINNFSLNLEGPTPNVWIFDTTGRVIPPDPGNITITGIVTPNDSHYGVGAGHAVDENFTKEFNFSNNFGYGSNKGKGDGGDVNFTYKVILSTKNLSTGDYKVTASLNTKADEDGNEISFTSTEEKFSIKAESSNGRSGGGGGGGGGTSGEDFKNILITETDRQYIGKNIDVKYNFSLDGNIVEHIEFTGLTSAGKVAAKVEILHNTSAMVDKSAPGIVFKNLNVWIGNMGYFSEKNVKDPSITFKVDRSWITENDIVLNTISFYSFNDDTKIWEKMSSNKIGENSGSYNFKASLPLKGTLGPMAISGRKAMVLPTGKPTPVPVITPTQNITQQPTPEITPTAIPVTWTGTWKTKVPGFRLFSALTALLSLYFISRRRD